MTAQGLSADLTSNCPKGLWHCCKFRWSQIKPLHNSQSPVTKLERNIKKQEKETAWDTRRRVMLQENEMMPVCTESASSGQQASMADELDWLEMLMASERIEKWLSIVCRSENSLASR